MDVDFAKALWKSADAVCFDVDSTVCTGEIIDQLARFLGKEKEISKLTSKAMGGDISFRESLKLRLQLMQPSLELVIRFLKGNPIDLTPGIRYSLRSLRDDKSRYGDLFECTLKSVTFETAFLAQVHLIFGLLIISELGFHDQTTLREVSRTFFRPLISMLQARSVDVYLLTGGFTHFVDRIAEELGVPLKNVYANKLLFDENGLYSGFDETVPTSKDDGKRVICGQLKELHGYERLIMVGDGMTDACASPPADVFIGFGGNQVRQAVVNKAHWYVYSFQELTDVLNN